MEERVYPVAPSSLNEYNTLVLCELVVRVRFLSNGQPRSGIPYKLTVGTATLSGSTDSSGIIQAPVPGDVTTGKLVLGQGPDAEEYEVKLGPLGSVSEKSGAAARLSGLGFYRGAQSEAELESAICNFQQSRQLKVTGTLDDPTQRALLEAFGS